MTLLDQFITDHLGKPYDFDGAFPNQCVDLAKRWAQLNQKPIVNGSGKDWDRAKGYDYVPVGVGVPNPGDIVSWGTTVGPSGHVAVVIHADNHGFTSFDQNWPIGSPCHIQNHTYQGVTGWLKVGGGMDLYAVNHNKVDAIEQIFLNRELGTGDSPAVDGRAQLVTNKINAGEPTHSALNEIVEDIVKNAQGDDRERLRETFNHWLSLIP